MLWIFNGCNVTSLAENSFRQRAHWMFTEKKKKKQSILSLLKGKKKKSLSKFCLWLQSYLHLASGACR